jgi:predicted kinase
MNNEELIDKFSDTYIDLLPNREIVQPAIMLTFSGIPGSDKTTLARKLAKDLKAQWLQHDDIRHVIAASGYDPRRLSMVLISRLIIKKIVESDKNKFVIMDLSIDRTWDRLEPFASDSGIKLIIIRLNVPLDVLQKRLAEREGVNYFDADRFEEFVMDFEASKKHIKADFELEEHYDYNNLLEDIKKLVLTK